MKKFSRKHWLIIFVILLVGLIFSGTWILQRDPCSETKIIDVLSPNNTKAILYTRDCGALASYTTNIEIANEKIFIADGYYKDKITMRWDSDNKFVIDYSGDNDRLFSYYKLFDGIDIELVQH